MSDMKRFKRDIRVDGRPVVDTEEGITLSKSDIVVFLNELDSENKRLKDQLTERN